MKIEFIIEGEPDVFEVGLTPNFFERIIGISPKTKSYYYIGSRYTFGGGGVYIDKNGNRLGNGHWIGDAIDRFLLSKQWPK